ncbi:MAG: DUF2851 family protein [Bacteroidales bacterium]|nr:DUF2851 family protein [Bacteroidales bacterium]
MELLMQYIWQHRLFPRSGLTTVDGERVEVIDRGCLNTASGPDFFNAKVKIGERMWAGDVEIHVKASDWHRHGHDGDSAYDSVILHVVDSSDARITRSNGETLPQMELPRCETLGESYRALSSLAPGPELPCSEVIGRTERLYLTDWLTALALERLHAKADRILNLNARLGGDWTQTVLAVTARGLGFGTNSDPMERLGAGVPLMTLLKHSDNHLAVEALLFGQSGLLDRAPADDSYANALRAEHAFLCRKFSLSPLQGMVWKMSGMRPAGFPHRRIALLAAMIGRRFTIASQIAEADSAEAVGRLFDLPLSDYWQSRYTFGPPSAASVPKTLSAASVTSLTINVAAPLMLARSRACGACDATERAVALLETLPAERNTITRLFAKAGLRASDALESQALIELRRSYCEARKCLYCRVGHRLLAARLP